MVPKNHLLRAIEKAIDWSFIYDEVKGLYVEERWGNPGVDPVSLIKIVMLQYIYGIPSMRQTIREIEVNNAYRWFIGYDIDEAIPHFSTFGKNYSRRVAYVSNTACDRQGFFKKYEYAYDEFYDCYVCPQNQILKYSTTNSEGYREYKSHPKICKSCPSLESCTLGKEHQKTVNRHVWQEYVEEADHYRYVPEYRDIYKWYLQKFK